MNNDEPSETPERPSYQWVFVIMAVVLMAGVLYAFWPFFVATRQMQTFCKELAVGTSLDAVRAQAEQMGYEVSPIADGHALVEDPVSYGRRTCNLRFGAQGLEGVEP